jgi:hypothetical protein
VDVIPPEIRAEHRAAARAAQSDADRSAEAAESQRVLEAIAPPMQHPESR